MGSWRWWHLAGLWLAAIALAVGAEWRSGNRFRARATSGGGLIGVRTPFGLRAFLALVFVLLVVVTVMWFRSRSGGSA